MLGFHYTMYIYISLPQNLSLNCDRENHISSEEKGTKAGSCEKQKRRREE
jgi:hypothetical protein